MSDKNGHKSPPSGRKPKPWERQPGESEPAFQAFRTYLEMGEKRSVRAVGQKLDKSRTIIGKWSSRWKWPSRVRKHTDSLTKQTDKVAEDHAHEKAIEIMTSMEVLGLTSLLGRTSFDDILDDKGRLDLAKARRTSAIFAIKKLTFYRSGRVRSVELRDKSASLELLGKHHALWTGEWEDPLEKLAEVLNVPRRLLPAHFDLEEARAELEAEEARRAELEERPPS